LLRDSEAKPQSKDLYHANLCITTARNPTETSTPPSLKAHRFSATTVPPVAAASTTVEPQRFSAA
jgi:hypothetical protein